MGPLIAMAVKDLRLLFRDYSDAFFVFVFPMLIAVFFGYIFRTSGSSGEMEIAMVDEDGGKNAAAFVEDLRGSGGLKLIDMPDREKGLAMVRTGKVGACVIVPKGFQESSENIFAGQAMKIEAITDPSRRAEAGLLTGKLNEVGFRQLSRAFGDTSRLTALLDSARKTVGGSTLPVGSKGQFGRLFDSLSDLSASGWGGTTGTSDSGGGGGPAWQPVTVTVTDLEVQRSGPQNSYEISFPQGVVWGLMGCVMAFGTSLAGERSRGTLMRLTTSPLTRGRILLGKALGCFIACLLVQAILLALAVLAFHVVIRQPVMMAVAVIMSALGFVGVMMLLAGLCRTEGAANGLGRALMIVLAMVGGGSVPLFFLPKGVQLASGVSPFKWASDVISGAMWRGFTPAEMLVPCLVLLGFGVVGYAVGASAFRWSEGS